MLTQFPSVSHVTVMNTGLLKLFIQLFSHKSIVVYIHADGIPKSTSNAIKVHKCIHEENECINVFMNFCYACSFKTLHDTGTSTCIQYIGLGC